MLVLYLVILRELHVPGSGEFFRRGTVASQNTLVDSDHFVWNYVSFVSGCCRFPEQAAFIQIGARFTNHLDGFCSY